MTHRAMMRTNKTPGRTTAAKELETYVE